MRKLKFLPSFLGVLLVIAIPVYFAFHFIFLDLFVDLWWYESLKLEGFFWLKLLYKFFIFAGVTLVFFSIFFLHFWIASRYLGLNPPDEVINNVAKRLRFQRVADIFMSGSIIVYAPVSLLLAIFIAIPFYNHWELSLLYFFGRDSGVTESIYGNDVSFYMLSYPIYILIQQELLVTAVMVLVTVGSLYILEHLVIPNQRKEYNIGAKIHLTVLIGFIVVFVIWGFFLHRFSLLYTNVHEPVFFGPGVVEMCYQLPLIWMGIISFLILGVLACLFVYSKQFPVRIPFFIALFFFISSLWLPNIEFIPGLINKFIVAPNPVESQRPYIQYNIDATLNAYDLRNIKTVELDIKPDPTADIKKYGNEDLFNNIPVWDREYLFPSYKELQEIRPYYQFVSVDEDRYDISKKIRQVNVAAREINISKLPMAAQNWENTHMRYTHGYGAVMSPAAQAADIPLLYYLQGLNLQSDAGLTVKHPEIYYGEEQYGYAIVPNKLNILGLEDTDTGREPPYTGKGGIPIPSYFRKLLLATYFKDEKIFFSNNISDESLLMIRRNIVERVHEITPFLQLDKDPYLVVVKDRLYWIQDAYTLSNWYPLAKPANDDFLEGDKQFNYIRNSVKVIVDAFEGTVEYYISDPSDPIIQAYSRAYPGLLKSLDKMPDELHSHLRYPRDLYYMQMKVYAKYHQNTPELFFEQGETWQFATVHHNELVRPYFQTMSMGNCNNQQQLVMINPMTPINRTNLSMLGIASTLDKTACGSSYKPNITVYKFGQDIQVNGPAQIDALMDQDPDISAQFTLWDQHGSKVGLGRMIILPMGNTILYVQPVYLTSTVTEIPQLARVVVSIENLVVMDTTLWGAFERLKQMQKKYTAQSVGAGVPYPPQGKITKPMLHKDE